MDLFNRANAVRLRSHHDKYLVADEDEEHVKQDRNGSSRNARWTVEVVEGFTNVLRFKSCYGKYLTASGEPFLLGATGKKVTQTVPRRLDSSIEWEPIREGFQVKLKTRYGNYLRANNGLPPWRNSVTHDVPHRTSSQDTVFWHVDIVDVQATAPARTEAEPELSRLESTPSFSEPIHIVEGRSIYYQVAEDDGTIDDNAEWPHLTFIGTSVPELTERLKELTDLDDIIVCTKNPFNHNLMPLRLELPPSNSTMKLVVVDANSSAGHKFRGDVDES